MRVSQREQKWLWQPMVVVALLFLVVSGLFTHLTRRALPAEGLFALNIERSDHAKLVAYYADEEWISVDREVIYGCEQSVELSAGDQIIYRGALRIFGSTPYIYIRGAGVVDRVEGCGGYLFRLNEMLYQRLRSVGLSARCEAVVATMLLSRDDTLTKETREHYRRSGAAHILAVSGLHVSIVALVIFVLLSPLGLLFRGNVLRVLLVVLSLWIFAFANFMGASVERAVIMYTLLLLGTITFREYNSLSVLAVAVVVMSIVDPATLFDVGFQLSTVAVLSIFIWSLPLWRARPSWLLVGGGGVVAEYTLLPMLISLCCTIATMPIVVYNFGYQPLFGFLITPLLYLTSFTILLLATLSLALGCGVLRYPLEWSVDLQNWAVERISSGVFDAGASSMSIAGLVIIYLLFLGSTIYVKENYKDKSL